MAVPLVVFGCDYGCVRSSHRQELWFLVDTCRVPLSRFSADELHSYLANGAEGGDPAGLRGRTPVAGSSNSNREFWFRC